MSKQLPIHPAALALLALSILAAAGTLIWALQRKQTESPENNSRASETTPESSAAMSEFEKTLHEAKSWRVHYDCLAQIAKNMIALGYEDSRPGSTIRRDSIAGLLVGVRHAFNPERKPIEKAWRLNAYGGERPNEIPVSFLKVDQDSPYSDELLNAAIGELLVIIGHRPAGRDLLPWSDSPLKFATLRKALLEAHDNFKLIRSKPLKPLQEFSWVASSSLRRSGDHRSLVEITEWPSDRDYPNGASRIMVYILYVQPGMNVDFKDVHGGGFRYSDGAN